MSAAMFGLFISANYALTSVIIVDIISLEHFTNAYGLLLLSQGIANLVGPPIGGKILLCIQLREVQPFLLLCSSFMHTSPLSSLLDQ